MFGLERYNYRASKTYMVYTFQSQGPNGVIQKIAKFTNLGKNVYNFGFGDLDTDSGNISDTITSNNGDIDTIMGTLGSILYDFTNIFMEALIIIEGTNESRTRLYQMNINKHWDRIHPVFEIFGLSNNKWEAFKKGINYQAIAGCRKGAFFLPNN